jgi:hypothetical protein
MKIAVLRLSVAVALSALPSATAAAAGQTPQAATIEGTACDSSGKPLPNAPVQTRNMQSGQIAGSVRTDGNGQFRFADLSPATYIVELLNDARRTIATSSEVSLVTVPHASVRLCKTDRKPAGWWRTTPAVLAAAGAVGITTAIVSTRGEASPVR